MLKLAVSAAAATIVASGVLTVSASANAAPVLAAARCHAHRVAGTSHWTCVTPGSYCPAAAHHHYGYAVKTGRRYRCVEYSNGRWRWKRV